MPGLRFTRSPRALALASAGAAVVLVAAILVLVVPGLLGPRPSAPTTLSASPDSADPFRPVYHNAPPVHWMNDPQRPLLIGGVWHAYYLYNADFPHGNGTSWRHMTSTDLVHWKDEGVAIEKFGNGLGDVETGSVVVDSEGTAGFGKGAIVALLTQQLDGVQRQSLFGSTDGGRSFVSSPANPVMENPGQKDWRDPKIFRDEAHHEWVMALAEGGKIGFYTSSDLRTWRYASGFEAQGLGVLECPDLFELNLDGDPQKPRWVLLAGANGASEGRTTGTVYWTGSWDGTTFVPDGQDGQRGTGGQPRHQWADDGPDFYATVTWDDPRLSPAERGESRYMMAWMNNWAYANGLPTGAWQGEDSIVRKIRLATVDGGARLISEPLPALGDGRATNRVSPETLGEAPLERAQPDDGAFTLEAEFSRDAGDTGHEARIVLTSAGAPYATVGYDFAAGQAFLVRGADAFHPPQPQEALYRAARTAPGRPGADRVRLRVLVDRSSVEVFIDDGERSLTALTFPPRGDRGYNVQTAGGTLGLRSLAETPLG